MRTLVAVLAACLVILAPGGAAAAEAVPSGPNYLAPQADPAPRRIGGSSRGVPPALPWVSALVPDHLGLTISEQPTLYWYLSAPTAARIELVLIEPGTEAPLLELGVSGSVAGIQRVDLGAHGVRLRPDTEYEWSVALVPDHEQRSRDIVSGGAIMRVERGSDTQSSAAALAARGIWYDALMALERDESRAGDGAYVRGLRARMFEQAGLSEVSTLERR